MKKIIFLFSIIYTMGFADTQLMQPSKGVNPNDHSYDIGNGAMANIQSSDNIKNKKLIIYKCVAVSRLGKNNKMESINIRSALGRGGLLSGKLSYDMFNAYFTFSKDTQSNTTPPKMTLIYKKTYPNKNELYTGKFANIYNAQLIITPKHFLLFGFENKQGGVVLNYQCFTDNELDSL